MEKSISYKDLIKHRRSWENAGRANFLLKYIIKVRTPVIYLGLRAGWLFLFLFALSLILTGVLVYWPWALFGISMICFLAVIAVVLLNEIGYRVRANMQNVWSLERNLVIDTWETYENEFPERASRLAVLSQEKKLRDIASIPSKMSRRKI